MKKKIAGILVVCLIISVLGIYKLDTIYEKLSAVRRWMVDVVYPDDRVDMENFMKEKKCDVDAFMDARGCKKSCVYGK